jgi:hypothetical protein
MVVVPGRIHVLRMANSLSAEQSTTYKCKEGPPQFLLDTPKHPYSSLQPAVIMLSPAETALIYFDNLSRAPWCDCIMVSREF